MRKILMALIVGLAVSGCNDSLGPGDPSPHAGEYHLESINGEPLPWIAQADDTGMVEIIDGSITLNSDWTYVDQVVVRLTLDSGTTEHPDWHSGSYRVEGETISFFSSGWLDGDFVDDTIVLSGTEIVAVYRK